ncbi:hypothetical protein ACVWW3_000431 [Bradyrhizobium sp. LM2.9]
MAKPAVVVVGADKGGVGKTTVSRTLLDYFSANNVPTRAFDTESPRGTLKRFHPDITEIVDMTTTSDQMKIFDTLNATSPSVTVIDVRAGLLSPALASLRDIGFLDAAKAGQITFAVFHILGPSIASLDEIAETAGFMTGAKYFLVKNFINDTQFFQWDQATYNSYFHRIKDATELTIPKLNEMAYEQVEVSSGPVPQIRRQQGHQRRGRELFVRAPRLCPALAGERLERIRPDPTDRHRRLQARRPQQRKIVADPGWIRLDWAVSSLR